MLSFCISTKDALLDAVKSLKHIEQRIIQHFRQAHSEDINAVVLACASPLKFDDVTVKAGIELNGRRLLDELREKEARYTDWEIGDDWDHLLRQLIINLNTQA